MRSLINLFIFIPYYFNAKTHVQYFFSPWKRIVVLSQNTLDRLIGNLASRGIGAILRLCVLFAALIVLAVYVLIFPVLALLVMIAKPVFSLWNVVYPQENEIHKEREKFVTTHCLDKQNRAAVITWFEQAYAENAKQRDRFSLDNLLATVPIGHDWNYGFTPLLDQYAATLTGFGVMGEGLSDRKEEIAAITRELSRSYESNAVLVGEEGVGKHTIINGFAQNVYEGRIIGLLQHFRIVELSMDRILASSPDRAKQIELLSAIMEEARIARNIILVIDNIHLYTSSQLSGDFSSTFTHYAQSAQLKLLGITTPFYFQQVLFNNTGFQELFHKVDVKEMKNERVMAILQEKALILEHDYSVTISYETLLQVIERSTYYITHIPFPEKAIDLLHEAAVRAKEQGIPVCVPQHVDEVIEAKTHMPVGLLSAAFKTKLKSLSGYLQSHILGQKVAMDRISKASQRAFIDENRLKPKLSLLLLGPTGVGKTETAKLLASIFFGARNKMLRFDMSFYSTSERAQDLIGSFEQKKVGLLAESIRETPFSVLLIDEFEKADTQVRNIFLTLLDEGYVVDGYGKKVDAKNLIVIATSNAASSKVYELIGTNIRGEKLEQEVKEYVISQGIMSPELLNRFDQVLVFEPLTLENAQRIALELAQKLQADYQRRKKITIRIDEQAIAHIVKQSFDPRFGVREVKRAVEAYVVGQVTRAVL